VLIVILYNTMVKGLIGRVGAGVQDSVYGNSLPHHTYIDRVA